MIREQNDTGQQKKAAAGQVCSIAHEFGHCFAGGSTKTGDALSGLTEHRLFLSQGIAREESAATSGQPDGEKQRCRLKKTVARRPLQRPPAQAKRRDQRSPGSKGMRRLPGRNAVQIKNPEESVNITF